MFSSTRRGTPLLLALIALSCTRETTQTPDSQTQVITKAWTDTSGDEFFKAPWPDDRRLDANGKVPLMDFPNPRFGDLFNTMLKQFDRKESGWGLSSPVFIPFSAAIDPASLPQTPTTDASASVYLMAIDPSSPELGQRRFLDFKFFSESTLFLPANVLAARPVPGFPLRPKTKYALVITTSLKDAGGQPIAPDSGFKAVLDGSASSDQAAFYKPLFDELARQNIAKSTVAGAVIFTTQPMLEDLIVLRDFLLNFNAPAPAMDMNTLKVVSDEAELKRLWAVDNAPPDTLWILQGTYKAPYMQHGQRPFLVEGGDFKFDDKGTPIPAFIEDMRVTVCVPKGAPPAGGFPAVFYSHGTGGNFEHVVKDICLELTQRGIMAFGIDQVISFARSGTTNPNACFGMETDNCFFNFANPTAARANLKQAALDQFALRRMANALVIPPSLHPEGLTVTVNPSKYAFFGHSQGGLTAALYSAIDPDLPGALISGAGGHLSTTILKRKGPEAKPLAEGPLFLNIAPEEELEPYHPALAMAQMLVESADPLNYARYWFKEPLGRPKHILSMTGRLDQFTVSDTAEALAVAAGMPMLKPVPRDSELFRLAGLTPVSTPLKLNQSTSGSAKVTAAYRQFSRYSHWPAFDDAGARIQWATFFETLFRDGDPTVPTVP